jgi:hypothetical protein
MVSMRRCLGLVLGVGALAAVAAPAAVAANYCVGPVSPGYGCEGSSNGIQGALDAAAAHPGADMVLIGSARHTVGAGLLYSDHGQPDNGVTIKAGPFCDRSGCGAAVLVGGTPGGTMLGFAGGGGAEVRVEGLELEPGSGVTGLMVPPGGFASVRVAGADGSIGIRSEGTPAAPPFISASVTQPVGGALDIGIDAVGAATLEYPFITSDVGVRSSGSDGLVDIRLGSIHASTGVTGRQVRLTRAVLDLRNPSGSAVGLEAVCPDAGTPDAQITATNVTLVGNGGSGSTGARAVARGGDGEACNAAIRSNSSTISGFATSLEAQGESGSGTDPQDGVARFEMAYSNFDPAAIIQSGPSELETASAGGNVYGNPRFNPRADLGLSWDSPLIDHGDPAPLTDPPGIPQMIANGRRDIGAHEYQFFAPGLQLLANPRTAIPRGGTLRLSATTFDLDFDPVRVLWKFSDGEQREYVDNGQGSPGVTRRYPRLGTYVEEVVAIDPTGRSATERITVEVRRQRMLHLSILHPRLRPPHISTNSRPTRIRFKTSVPDLIYFRVERGVQRKRSRALRWVRTRHRFRARSQEGMNSQQFNGWIEGDVLRPGRYRLAGAPRGLRPLRARFRVLPARR